MALVQQSSTQSGGSGGGGGNLYDVLELILDRGLVIDAFVRVSLVGIEILKIDVRVVVASVDTYLRFAEACNRLDLEAGRKAPAQLTDIVGDTVESGAKGKSKGALTGAVEAFTESLGSKGDDSEQESQPRKRAPRKSTSSRQSSQNRGE
ncbi:gas vesicle protein GvpA/GvpJ/GvpM family [Streptomyces sp. BK022]|uniref:gas vesicle structural protein GvpA n=1 Tax=Streptomyces sp. BK022 TaxID=2512123 RepID=UPI001028E3E2|nr:gas vesicle structural protein GvpA [Streptomyces sp. BK022]RZU45895.1 gas vesicle protein GvpA/GvpJ/GvpM family [Streptomyces sp. BK022]